MNLRERLAKLRAPLGKPAAAPATGRFDDPPHADPAAARDPVTDPMQRLRAQLASVRPERLRGQPRSAPSHITERELAAQLGGTLEEDGLIRIERRIDLAERCGAVPLSRLHAVRALPGETPRDNAPPVYLDTETTGLSGGSGTISFLIGIATLTPTQLHLSQWLITRFSAEPRQLAQLLAALAPHVQLVSYNGKSFDLPLLETRLRLHGITDPLTGLPHLDLLHPVRRLFAAHWPDCRLASVEQHLLDLRRHQDLPGSEAPLAWFDWLQRGDGQRLTGIVAHNRQDLVSLAAAHAVVSDLDQLQHRADIDLHGLAKWLADHDAGQACALLGRHFGRLDARALRLYARLLQRRNDWDGAVAIWERLATRGCEASIEDLAKFHEHRRRDYATAFALTRRLGFHPATRRRSERLERKLAGLSRP
ncbi:MAG: ribonuclease H-like domain-containing protein [Thiotrichales bacterium]